MKKVRLKLEEVHKTYPGGLVALDGVSLSVEEGEFVTIIGPSGCGKSTLFNLIAGLGLSSRGKILLDGREIAGRTGLVGYMPQKDLLLPWRNVLDNVILGPELAGEPRERARREAKEMLPLFGLEEFANSYPATLSGGMRQRAAFLRTVLCHKDVMLLDEPFGALDALTRAQMQVWLLDLWERLRRTVLFVTHDIDEALLLSDRVYVLSARPGRVRSEMAVRLARPRRLEMVTTATFVQMKKTLLETMELAAPAASDGRINKTPQTGAAG